VKKSAFHFTSFPAVFLAYSLCYQQMSLFTYLLNYFMVTVVVILVVGTAHLKLCINFLS